MSPFYQTSPASHREIARNPPWLLGCGSSMREREAAGRAFGVNDSLAAEIFYISVGYM